ncbi:germ cell nuclear acidic protein-like [Palaemon carinicauda]|uniref:germ cell nuclear acidic protein-like n=1 Tax=Palaemon carinicauda TaxID=392227 RepID=UPI0035B60E17
MSSSDRESMGNSESLKFSIKTEMEESFSHTAVNLENNRVVDSLHDMEFKAEPEIEFKVESEIEFKAEPEIEFKAESEIEFKAEPEIFESSESDMKYSLNLDASVSEEDLQISKREADKEEEEIVRTGVKEECDIQLGSSKKEDKGKGRGRGKEWRPNKKEHIENSSSEKPLCKKSDSKSHIDVANSHWRPFQMQRM